MQKYNTGHYNRKSDLAATIDVGFEARETINCVAGFGSDIAIDVNFNENILANQILTIGLPAFFEVQEEVFSNVIFQGSIGEKFIASESIYGDLYFCKDMGIKDELNEKIEGTHYFGKDIDSEFIFEDKLENMTILSKDLIFDITFSETLLTEISSQILERLILFADCTIPPGGVLEIDSNTFNMYLNNSNIIHLHRGDFVNLERGLVSVDINSGTAGNLTGKIIFNERYL